MDFSNLCLNSAVRSSPILMTILWTSFFRASFNWLLHVVLQECC
jgi:hypothetical protein